MSLVIKKKQAEVQESVTKAKAKSKSKVTQTLTETQAMVNEMVHLEATMRELEVSKMQARYDELKKRLHSIANEHFSGDEEVTLAGTEGRVVFSPRRATTVVEDRDLMIEKLTPDTFMQLANVTITDLKKYLSGEELSTFTGQTMGSRTLKTVIADN